MALLPASRPKCPTKRLTGHAVVRDGMTIIVTASSCATIVVAACSLIDIELLLMQRRIAFHDNGPLCQFFHLGQQTAIASLQLFGHVLMHAQHHAFTLQMLVALAPLPVHP